MTKQTKIEQFKEVLCSIAKDKGVEPAAITKAVFLTNTTAFSEWDLRKLGGFAALQKIVAPVPEHEPISFGTKYVNAFMDKLAKKQGVDEFLKDEFLAQFKEILPSVGISVHPAYKGSKGKKNKRRAVVAQLSDTHFGANIKPDEMNDINEFNWDVAARRLGLFAEQIVNYKPQYRNDTKLILAINGDLIAGMIHDTEFFSDLLARQTAGAMSYLIQFISYCASKYPEVEVYFTTGNHGRSMHKTNKSRATTHKWDSYETCIYLGVKHAIEAKCRNVKCTIPLTPYALINVFGHMIMQTHGDTVINVGNPGRSLNMKSINTQINSINSSRLTPVKLAAILLGHVHVATTQICDNGTVLVINASLSGADPFCQSIGIFGNEPSQTLFEVTPDFPVGDIRFIKLKGADSRKDLEKIISPLKGDLE